MKELFKDLDVVVLIRFGSHLYGTETENSDTDYKGVFMPTREQVLLGNIPKSVRLDSNNTNVKNTKDDVDAEMYSLHYFIELACKGETVALDMLHANSPNILHSSSTWEEIVKDRSKFLTKNLKSFVGYARKQAAKYGVKGSRLNTAQEFVSLIDSSGVNHKEVLLKDIKNALPLGDHARLIEDSPNGLMQYQICGKILQGRVTLAMARSIMSGFLRAYGDRAKQAAENKGVDWKAVSHALRAAYQTKELLTTGEIKYPLAQADFLREVKVGSLDFLSVVLPTLEAEMVEVETLSLVSEYPDTVDREYWNDFLVKTLLVRCI